MFNAQQLLEYLIELQKTTDLTQLPIVVNNSKIYWVEKDLFNNTEIVLNFTTE